MKRLDLLRSPVFLLALAALVVNDFALKPLFHNAFTGKLSDFAGLAAFTLFLCSLWRGRRVAIALGVSAAFALWKSPYAQGLIDAANAILPFPIGRTVDYSDLAALPVVWLCCAYAGRLPLLPLRPLLVGLVAGFSLVAFTATSMVRRDSERQMAEIGPTAHAPPAAEREADIQRMLDALAQSHRLHCTVCKPLAMGRVYQDEEGTRGPMLEFYAFYDSRQQVLLYELSWDIREGRQEAAALRAELKRELAKQLPFVYIHSAAGPSDIDTAEIDVARKDGMPVKDDAENTASYQATLPIVRRIAVEAGLEPVSEYSFSAGPLLGLSGERELNITVYPYGPQVVVTCRTLACKGRVAPLAQKIESALRQEFGRWRVSRD